MTPMLINGRPAGAKSAKCVEVLNPANDELVGCVPVASEEDVDAAVRSSAQAFAEWRDTPAVERAATMMEVVGAVRQRTDEIAQLLSREQGKPYPQAQGELNGFCAVMEFYAQEARRITGMVLQSDHRDRFVYALREPVGVVAAIPPWNDPLHLLSRMIGPALAAGCTVVAKPSSETPLATLLTAQTAVEAGLRAGVLNVVTGPGDKVGEDLARHPLVRKIAMTGSVAGGRQVMAAAAEGIKRVTLELGGQCPCIVWDDADVDKAADAITFQAFRGCGQVCNRVNRVYAHEAIADELVKRVAELAGRIVVGEAFAEGVDIGPLINARQLAHVAEHVTDAVNCGAKVLTGGKRVGRKGYFYQPTVLADCNQQMKVMREETFGPVLAMMTVGPDLDRAFELANDTIYGLSAFFFSADQRKCFLAARRLEAGSVWINDIHGSMLQAPYGGIKASGIGREQGAVAVGEYLEWKTVYHEMSRASRGPRLCAHHGKLAKPGPRRKGKAR